MHMLRILFLGFVLWLLCGAVPERAVAVPVVCGAELSEADCLGDQFRCERLYNSDFNLTRGLAEAVVQISFRSVIRTEDPEANPLLKWGVVNGFNRGTMSASRSCGYEGTFVCGPVVDYYVYRLRRLII